jgi:hypothetical protein
METDYVTLFCFVDDFCKGFEPGYKKHFLTDGKTKRNRDGQLTLAEILTTLIAYHR